MLMAQWMLAVIIILCLAKLYTFVITQFKFHIWWKAFLIFPGRMYSLTPVASLPHYRIHTYDCNYLQLTRKPVFHGLNCLRIGVLYYLPLISQNMPDREQLPNECILIEEINAKNSMHLWEYMQGCLDSVRALSGYHVGFPLNSDIWDFLSWQWSSILTTH